MSAASEGTRTKLVAAATRTIYELGYATTTLARVAQRARVPLGNVYYHFRTKESLAEAVIEHHLEQLRERLLEAEKRPRPEDRIAALLAAMSQPARCREIARCGCPHGSLADELEKGDSALGGRAGRMIELQLSWYERQLKEMGLGRRAHALALELGCAVQGAGVVAHALGDPDVVRARLRELSRWVRGLGRAGSSLHENAFSKTSR